MQKRGVYDVDRPIGRSSALLEGQPLSWSFQLAHTSSVKPRRLAGENKWNYVTSGTTALSHPRQGTRWDQIQNRWSSLNQACETLRLGEVGACHYWDTVPSSMSNTNLAFWPPILFNCAIRTSSIVSFPSLLSSLCFNQGLILTCSVLYPLPRRPSMSTAGAIDAQPTTTRLIVLTRDLLNSSIGPQKHRCCSCSLSA